MYTHIFEIGSTEAEWGIPEAGKIWADCLLKHLKIRSVSDGISSSCVPDLVNSDGVVMVSIGGGHYVPKMNDVARYGPGMYTGHSLATYALQRHLDGTHRDPIEGGWQHIIKEAIESTKVAHSNAQLIVLLDKKAFVSEHKKSIISYLEESGIKWTHKVADVKKLWEEAMR
jgi:D-tyrosyl-tRNA(Tyr) deacylase